MYVISLYIKINILQDAGIQKLFFPVSSTPLSHLKSTATFGEGRQKFTGTVPKTFTAF